MKKLLIVIGGLIAVLLIIIAVALTNLGPLIKKAVNTYGPDITQTEVHVETVDASLFSGEVALSGFLLGNPKGFNTPNAMTIQSVQVNIDESSITRDPIVIEKIEVSAPTVNYEVKGKTDNFRALLNNIKETTGAQKAPPEKKPSEPAETEKPQKNILIKEFVLKNGTIHLAATLLKNKTVTVNLPDLSLTNIGGKKEGTSPAKAFQFIFEKLYQEIHSNQVRDAIEQQLKQLGKSLEQLKFDADGQLDQLREKSKKELDSVTDSVKNNVKGLLGN